MVDPAGTAFRTSRFGRSGDRGGGGARSVHPEDLPLTASPRAAVVLGGWHDPLPGTTPGPRPSWPASTSVGSIPRRFRRRGFAAVDPPSRDPPVITHDARSPGRTRRRRIDDWTLLLDGVVTVGELFRMIELKVEFGGPGPGVRRRPGRNPYGQHRLQRQRGWPDRPSGMRSDRDHPARGAQPRLRPVVVGWRTPPRSGREGQCGTTLVIDGQITKARQRYGLPQ